MMDDLFWMILVTGLGCSVLLGLYVLWRDKSKKYALEALCGGLLGTLLSIMIMAPLIF